MTDYRDKTVIVQAYQREHADIDETLAAGPKWVRGMWVGNAPRFRANTLGVMPNPAHGQRAEEWRIFLNSPQMDAIGNGTRMQPTWAVSDWLVRDDDGNCSVFSDGDFQIRYEAV